MRKMFTSPMTAPYASPYGSSGRLCKPVEAGGLRAKNRVPVGRVCMQDIINMGGLPSELALTTRIRKGV